MEPQVSLDLMVLPEKREKLDQMAQMVPPELQDCLAKMDTTEHRAQLDLKEKLAHPVSRSNLKSQALPVCSTSIINNNAINS
jgi:hypothetical protein